MWKCFYKDSKISGIAVSKSKAGVWVFRVMKDSEWWRKVYDPFHIWNQVWFRHERVLLSWIMDQCKGWIRFYSWALRLLMPPDPACWVWDPSRYGSPEVGWKVEMEKSWGSCSCRCQGMMAWWCLYCWETVMSSFPMFFREIFTCFWRDSASAVLG